MDVMIKLQLSHCACVHVCPCSNDDFCMSPCMTSQLILFVVPLFLKDIGAIEVYNYYYMRV